LITQNQMPLLILLMIIFSQNILYVLHYTTCIKSKCAKHFPLFIVCEKYRFDYTKSDASTDIVDDNFFFAKL
jgi:hypothetical protein